MINRRIKQIFYRAMLMFTIVPLLYACGSGNEAETDTKTGTTSLHIQIVSSKGESVTGVLAYANGKHLGSTDTTGALSLENLAPDTEVSIRFEKEGFANQVYRYKTGPKDASDSIQITMIAREPVQSFETDESVRIQGGYGATVELLGGEFVTESGEPVSGEIDLSMTPVDVSTPVGLDAFPGTFSAINDAGEEEPVIVTYGTTEFKFSQNGEELQLAPGKKATIELPIFIDAHPDGTKVEIGDEIPLWYLNEETGIWHQEGTGTVVASESSKTGFALRGEVSHFSWWNVDVAPVGTNVRFKVTATSTFGLRNVQARIYGDTNGFRTSYTSVPLGDFSAPMPVPAGRTLCFRAAVSGVNGQDKVLVYLSDYKCVETVAGVSKDVFLSASTSSNFTIQENIADTATAGGLFSSCGVPSRIVPSGHVYPIRYRVTAGALPAGLSLDENNGYIYGTPAVESVGASGLITVTALDALGRAAAVTFDIRVYAALETSTPTIVLPLLTVGTPASHSGLIGVSGGQGPYSYRIAGGSALPLGMSLNVGSGQFSGTPLATTINGVQQAFVSHDTEVLVRDKNCAPVTLSVSSQVLNPPKLSGSPAPVLSIGASLDFTAVNTGGAVQEWSLAGNPNWMSIEPTTGKVIGTPAATDVGIYTNIEIIAKNNLNNSPYPVGEDRVAFDIEVAVGSTGSQTISFENAGPISRSAGSPSFTNPATGGLGTGQIRYYSDKPEFATVDLLTGAVTPIANGTAIIKAIKDADAVYSQAEAEYTVIVENTLPMISSDTEIRFDVTSEQKQFTYKPTLVSGEIVTWDFYGENLPYWVIIDPDTGVISTNSIDNSYAGLYSDLTLVATNSKGSSEIRSISIAVVPDAAPNITMQTQIVNNKLEMIHNGPSEEIIFQNTGGFAGPGNWTVGGDFPNPETGWIQMVSYSWAPETALLISPSIAHLGTHTITVTADNGNGSSSVSFTLEIRLKMPYLQVGNNRDGLSVSWSSPGESLSPVSYDLYVSDQGDVSPDTFNDATADLIAGYQPGDLITTINGNAFSTGKKYNMMLVANYAGLETRSIPLHTLVSVLPDTGAKYCNAGSGIQYTCGIQNYPQQDGDLGLDAIQEQESGNNFEFKRFDVMDATMQVTAVEEQKQCIRDRATGLLWEYLPEKMTISNTGLAERITTVNTAAKCGKTNWRLPTTNELLSILNYGAQSDGKTTFVYSYPPFRLNEQGYTNPYKRYWTGDRESIAATYSWFVDFGHGLIEQNTTANMGTVHAILVSSDTVAPLFSERLSDLEDGTVIDSYTGLMWKKCTEGYRYNVDTKTCDVNTGDVTNFSWQDALLRAQEVNSGSAGRENYEKTDWRVPNVLELNSLMRREDGEASMFETSVFPNTSNEKRYWTNTPQSSGGNNAWSVGLVETGQASLNGMMHADSITTTNPVRLVRQSGITPVIRWYLDSDGDGFATRDIYVDSYIKPEGNYKKASGNWDCNDGDNLIHPYRSEIIDDGVDNNCNGIIDEGEFSGGA